MDYEQMINGARKYGLGDNIYDLAMFMISKNGVESKEALVGIFLLIFSWNRFYYTPPSRSQRPKSINVLDGHVEKFKETLKDEKEYIRALQKNSLKNVNFDVPPKDLKVTVGYAIHHLFSQFAGFLGSTGASKALHLLFPELIVMWDTQIREDYEVTLDADGFLEFQRMMKKLVDNILSDFIEKHDVKRNEAINKILELRYKDKTKTLAKLMDEFNWATKGQEKRHLLRGP